MSRTHKGRDGFEAFYAQAHGARWGDLRQALEAPVRQVARLNRFADREQITRRAREFPRTELAGREVLLLEEGERLEPMSDTSGRLDVYVMDAASIFAAAALEVCEGEEVLDLCAAPGGKSLIIAESLATSGRLTSNEMSDRRRARLRAVFEGYLSETVRARIRVTGHDGARWCLHETEAFDRVLVDAPCSGERHLIHDPAEMKLWSPARSRNLAVRQYALLASALAVVRRGGRIVYSTCSVSPLENDAVIARLLKKRAGEARILASRFEIGEPTEHGWIILPDRTGFGPIYFSTLERV